MTLDNINKIINDSLDIRNQLTKPETISFIIDSMKKETLSFSLTDENPFSYVPSKHGLYFIEVKFPFTTEEKLKEFGNKWGASKKSENKLENKLKCPRFYEEKVNYNLINLSKGEFVSFYLGKEKNIQTRLNEHLTDSLDSTTYGLKLKSRNNENNILDGCKFKVSFLTFDIQNEAYFCVELIESAIREKLNPLIGKQ